MTTPTDPTQPGYPRRSAPQAAETDPVAYGTDPAYSTAPARYGSETDATAFGAADNSTGAASVKDAGREVAGTAQDEARKVAATAGDQVSQVAAEAGAQARNLLDETLSEARAQTDDQMTRIGAKLRELATEMQQMAASSEQRGPVTQFADDMATRGSRLADWLEAHGPDELATSVRRYARRNPVTFLAAAAGAGLVVGRFARALQAGAPESTTGQRSVGRQYGEELTYGRPGPVRADTYPASSPGPGGVNGPGAFGTDPYAQALPGEGPLGADRLPGNTQLPGEGLR